MSIRKRLLLLVLAVWLPAVSGFALLAYLTYHRETNASRDQVEAMAQSLNAVVERELDGHVVMAKTLASSIAVRDRDLARFHQEASVAVNGSSTWAFLSTAEELVLTTLLPLGSAKPVPRPPGAEFATSAPTVAFRSRGLLSSKPVIGVFTPEAQVVPPVYNVGISFETSVIQEAVDRLRLPEGTVASVVDSKQLLIARSRSPEQWVGKPATGGIIRRMQSGQIGFAPSVTLDGVPSLAYLSPPNRYGWVVVVALPTAMLAKTADRLTVQSLIAAALLLLLGLALARYAASGIARPITQLRNAATALGENIVPPRLSTGVTEADEVGAALRDAGLRAQAATATLEEQVRGAVEEAREAQARLLGAQKHEAIGRLTGGIAHDFNNLLQTISTGHQILERTLPEGPPRRVLQSAQRATAKAAQLVKQMLTFGRAQALKPTQVNVIDLLLRSQELTRKGLGERVALEEKVEGPLPPVFVDATQLELALLNLVFNARDAMPDGGTVTVGARLAPAEESAAIGPGQYVCIEVADNGTGMDEHTRSKAFEPYFTTKPVGTGSGLGLAQVFALAQQSGGGMRLESELEKGTCVRMYLPVDMSAAPQPETTPEPSEVRPGAKLRILMVEDDTLLSSVVMPALQSEGHEVTLCGTADSAVLLLQGARAYDVLFTDVVMPGEMTGLDLVAWCHKNLPQLPVVVATGYTSQQDTHGAIVLSKPYQLEELVRSLWRAAG